MKKLLVALLLITFSSLQAQYKKNACAAVKMRAGTHNNSVNSMLASSYLVALENKYDLKFYHLNLNLSIANKNVSGNTRCLATVKTASIDSFAFELYNTFTIDSVILNGVKMPVSRHIDEARVAFTPTLAMGSTIDATVYYHGTAPTINGPYIGDGYSNGSSSNYTNTASYSLSECYHAYEWFPCKQQLIDKIDSSWVFVTSDSANKTGSNGVLSNVVTMGNQKTYQWKNNHPIDYYLISVSLAHYKDYSFYAHPAGYLDSILIQNYVYDDPQYMTNYKTLIDSTKQLVEYFSSIYGLYPWADQKYGHCITPLGGGMEHQTMTTMTEYLDFQTIAHELGHQWFGDKATCGTWHDIFINEGFADYTQYLALQHFEPNQAFGMMATTHTNVMSMPNGSIYNPDTTSETRIFDSRLSYDKGGAVLHTLRFVINNDSLFFAAYRNYLQSFNYSTATTADFKTSVETTTGLNLTQFFNQWIYGEGYPTFNVHWNQVGNNFIMRSIQTVSDYSITPLFITPIQYTIQRSMGDTTIRVMHSQDTAWYNLTINGTVTGIIVDSANWIINTVIGPTHDGSLAGIEEFRIQNSEFRIWPNPTSSMLNLELGIQNGATELQVADILGNVLIHNSEFITHNFALDVGGLTPGVYFVKTSKGTAKFIKQ